MAESSGAAADVVIRKAVKEDCEGIMTMINELANYVSLFSDNLMPKINAI